MDALRGLLTLLVVLAFALAGCGGESGVELPASLATEHAGSDSAPTLVYVYSDP